MIISNNIIKQQLKNVYFMCGGAYGGKTTMAKLIEEKYGLHRYRQGDHYDEYIKIAEPKYQPALCVERSKDWHGFKYIERNDNDTIENTLALQAMISV